MSYHHLSVHIIGPQGSGRTSILKELEIFLLKKKWKIIDQNEEHRIIFLRDTKHFKYKG